MYESILQISATTNSIADGRKYLKKSKTHILIIQQRKNDEKTLAFIKEAIAKNIAVIMISPFEKLALWAIKIRVAGYVIEPLKADKILNAISKVLQDLISKSRITDPEFNATFKYPKNVLPISTLSSVRMVPFEKIVYCEAKGKYTIFHFNDMEQQLTSKNLGIYEIEMGSSVFFRIHYKYLVNLNFVKRIQHDNGITCTLMDNTVLPIATRRYNLLLKHLKIK
ncbi:MAG: hypothetical protein Aureis2KO_25980 [Aureisphaera sp.]